MREELDGEREVAGGRQGELEREEELNHVKENREKEKDGGGS